MQLMTVLNPSSIGTSIFRTGGSGSTARRYHLSRRVDGKSLTTTRSPSGIRAPMHDLKSNSRAKRLYEKNPRILAISLAALISLSVPAVRPARREGR